MARFKKGEEVYYVNAQDKVLKEKIERVTKLKDDVRYLFSNGVTPYERGFNNFVNGKSNIKYNMLP